MKKSSHRPSGSNENVQTSALSTAKTSEAHVLERDFSLPPSTSVQSEQTSPSPQPTNEGYTLHVIKSSSVFNQKPPFLKWLMSVTAVLAG